MSSIARHALTVVREQIGEAIDAAKCHGCGCLQKTVEALGQTPAGQDELADVLEDARRVFVSKKYDCLGCAVCFPAIAANSFAESFPAVAAGMDLCPTDPPEERTGWPPLPGDYQVIRYRAPVAVCTLNSDDLAGRLAERKPQGLGLVGSLHTENLGIERIIRNVLANPYIRFLVLCGEDTRQSIGHLPGQSMQSLLEQGIDERGRIRGARGKRPVIKNVAAADVEAFRRQVTVVPLVGETREGVILDAIGSCDRSIRPVARSATATGSIEVIEGAEPTRLIPDPAGFFVIYPDAQRHRLVVEHYTNQGVLAHVLEGGTPASVYGEVVARQLLTRLDHAAYLGRELGRAQMSMQTGERYVQDRAPGELEPKKPETEIQELSSACACAARTSGRIP